MRTKIKGFTLIELLVVIAIIGILSTIVLANLNTARSKSRDGKRIADVKHIQLTLEQYAAANSGRYPVTLSALSPVYIVSLPTPPEGTSQTAYKYVAIGASAGSAVCIGYHIGAVLEQPNSVLDSDADAPDSDPVCTGSVANFNGGSNDCSTASGTLGMCFDVKNNQ